jgi:hypothetical protein
MLILLLLPSAPAPVPVPAPAPAPADNLLSAVVVSDEQIDLAWLQNHLPNKSRRNARNDWLHSARKKTTVEEM